VSNSGPPDRGNWRILLGADAAALRQALLSVGRARRDAGADVVIGSVGVPSDQPQHPDELDGLTVLPVVSVPNQHDGLDLDAIERRRPDVVLIEGLVRLALPDAESVPDVEAVRRLGAEVISTLRVDEIRSLADRAAELSPAGPHATIPDRALLSVDTVDVVPGDSTDELVALAHSWVSRRHMSHAARTPSDVEAWPGSIVVAFDADADVDNVIDRAVDLARATGARVIGAHVTSTAQTTQGPGLDRRRELLEAMGADVIEVVDDSPGWALARVAEAEGAQVVVQRGNVHGYLTLDQQTACVRGLDLYVVAPSAGAGARHPLVEPAVGKTPRSSELPRSRRMTGLLLAVIGLPLLTVILAALRDTVHLSTVLLLYLALTVAVTAVGGFASGLLSAVGGFALADYYFTRPLYHWVIADPNVIVALVVFVFVAVLVSVLVDIAARRSADAARSRAEATALSQLASAVLNSRDPLPRLLHDVRAVFGLDAAAIMRRSADGWVVEHSAGSPIPDKPADATDALSLGSDRYLALVGDRIPAEDSRVLAAFTAQLALAIEQRVAAESSRREERGVSRGTQ
jgi:two-component system sensor histidine kinase KdpD